MSENQTPEAESLNVYDALGIMMDQIAAIAWQKLGLQHDMVSGKIDPDLNQAKVAIDLVAHLVTVVNEQLSEDDRRQAQVLVRDLRMNYVEKVREAQAK